MSNYLLIESRDPFDSNDVANYYDLASNLAAAGNQVTLFLVQNGVLAARSGVKVNGVDVVAASGVEVLADEFSLRERGIAGDKLSKSVNAAPLDVVVDHLANGSKAIWH